MHRRAAPFLRFLAVPLIGCWFLGSCHAPAPGTDTGNEGGTAGEPGSTDEPCDGGVLCGGVCVDLAQNGRNCGGCGQVCPFGQACEGGSCACPKDQTLCETRCVSLNDDRQNCGTCANACRADRVCEGGECVCPEGAVACDGLCVDSQADPNHCGTCGLICGPLDVCRDGICRHRPGPTSDSCGGAARNLTLRAITANQAVEVPLFAIEDQIPTRNAPLVTGRPLLIRAFVDTEPAFSPRTLASRLYLQSALGQSVYYDKHRVASDSNSLDLSSTFNFFLSEGDLTEDMNLAIEVVECQTGRAEGPVLSPRAPKTDSVALELSVSPQISIGVVPIDHEGRIPDMSEANLALYVDALRAMFPIGAVQLSVLEPMASGQSGTLDFDRLLSTLQERRTSDQPEPNLYYFGFVRPKATLSEHCQEGDCTYGVGYQTRSPSFHAALGIEYGDQASMDTFVHEIGHNMGLGHAPCGTEGDPLYPYAGAALGSVGFDYRDQSLLDPSTTKDIMSYCDPAWASDYTYRTVFSALSPSVSVGARLTPGAVTPNAARDFLPIQVQGDLIRVRPLLLGIEPPEELPERALVQDSAGSELLETSAYRIPTGDSNLVTWLIPRPEPDWARLVLPDGTQVVLLEHQ